MQAKFPLPFPFILTITAQDKKKGKHSNCSECPAALALARLLPSDFSIRIVSRNAGIYQLDETGMAIAAWTFYLPPRLQEWISNFDGFRNPPPTSVRITEEMIRPNTLTPNLFPMELI